MKTKLNSKLLSALVVLGFSSLASAAWTPQGQYNGTCVGYYAGSTSNPCQMNLYVDGASQVTVPGSAACISPTAFHGVMFDANEVVNLRAAGWNAQPQGQTLNLTFSKSFGKWRATGTGNGISDKKWSYRCTFNQLN